jgi:hypothetical protein
MQETRTGGRNMLKIGYGCPEDIYFYIDLEFDTMFSMEWLEDEMNQKIRENLTLLLVFPAPVKR